MADTIEVHNSDSEEEEEKVKGLHFTLQRLTNKVIQILFENSFGDLQIYPYDKFFDFISEFKNVVNLVDKNSLSKLTFLWKMVIQWIVTIKMAYSGEARDLEEDLKFNLLLTDIMAEYITFKCNTALDMELDDSQREISTKHLIRSLSMIFSKNISFIQMTMLKIKILPQYHDILNPIFTKFLCDKKRPTNNDIVSHLRIVLYCRQWKCLFETKEEKEKINVLVVGLSKKALRNTDEIDLDLVSDTILTKFIPKANNLNYSFLSVSNSVKFAMERGDCGTRTLLTTRSLNLEESIQNYFKQYERLINGVDFEICSINNLNLEDSEVHTSVNEHQSMASNINTDICFEELSLASSKMNVIHRNYSSKTSLSNMNLKNCDSSRFSSSFNDKICDTNINITSVNSPNLTNNSKNNIQYVSYTDSSSDDDDGYNTRLRNDYISNNSLAKKNTTNINNIKTTTTSTAPINSSINTNLNDNIILSDSGSDNEETNNVGFVVAKKIAEQKKILASQKLPSHTKQFSEKSKKKSQKHRKNNKTASGSFTLHFSEPININKKSKAASSSSFAVTATSNPRDKNLNLSLESKKSIEGCTETTAVINAIINNVSCGSESNSNKTISNSDSSNNSINNRDIKNLQLKKKSESKYIDDKILNQSKNEDLINGQNNDNLLFSVNLTFSSLRPSLTSTSNSEICENNRLSNSNTLYELNCIATNQPKILSGRIKNSTFASTSVKSEKSEFIDEKLEREVRTNIENKDKQKNPDVVKAAQENSLLEKKQLSESYSEKIGEFSTNLEKNSRASAKEAELIEGNNGTKQQNEATEINLETSNITDENLSEVEVIEVNTNENVEIDLQDDIPLTKNLNKEPNSKERSDMQNIVLEKNLKNTSLNNSMNGTLNEQHPEKNTTLCSNLETSRIIDANIKKIEITKQSTDEKTQVDLQNSIPSTQNLNKEQNFNKETSDIQDIILEKNRKNTSLNLTKSTPNEQNSDKNLTLGSNFGTTKTIDANIKNIKIKKHGTNEKPQVDLQNKTTSTSNLNKKQNFKETSDIQDIILEKNVKTPSLNNSIKGTLNEQNPEKNSTLGSNLETSKTIDANIKNIKIIKHGTNGKPQVDLQNQTTSTSNLNKEQNFKERNDIQDIILEENGKNTSLNKSMKGTLIEQHPEKSTTLCSNLETSRIIDANIKKIETTKQSTDEKTQVDLQNSIPSTQNLKKEQNFNKETSHIQDIILEKNGTNTSLNSIKSTPNEQNSDKNLTLGSNLETSKTIDANIKNIKIIKHGINEKPQVDLQNKTTSTSNLNKEQNFKETSDIQDIILEKNGKNTSLNSIKSTLNEQNSDKNLTLGSNLETSKNIDANIKNIKIITHGTNEKLQVDLQNKTTSTSNLNKKQNFEETSDIQDIILEKNGKNTSLNSIKSTPNEQNSDKNLTLGSNLETSKNIDANIKNIKIITHGTNVKPQVDLQNKTTSTSNLNKEQNFKETSDIQDIILEKNGKNTSLNSIKSTPNEQNSDKNLTLGSNLETSKTIDANIKNIKIIKHGTNEKLQVDLQNKTTSTSNLNKEQNFKETSDIQDIILEKNEKDTSQNSIKSTSNEQNSDKNLTSGSNLETSKNTDANIKNIKIIKHGTNEKLQVDLQNKTTSTSNLNKTQKFKETSDIQDIILEKNGKNTSLNSIKSTPNEQNSDKNLNLGSNLETSKNIDANIKNIKILKHGTNEKLQVDLQNKTISTSNLNKEQNFKETSDIQDIIVEKNVKNTSPNNSIKGTLNEQHPDKNSTLYSNLETSKTIDANIKNIKIIKHGTNEKLQVDLQNKTTSTSNLNKKQKFKETSDIQDIILEKNEKDTSQNSIKSTPNEQNSDKNLNFGSNLENSKTIDANIKNIKILKHGTNEKPQVDLQNKTTSTSNLNKEQNFKETSDIQDIILEKNEKDTSQNSIKSTSNEQNSDKNLTSGSNLETSKNTDANIKNIKIIKHVTNEKLQVDLQNKTTSTSNLNKKQKFKETSDIQDIILEKNGKNTSPNSIKSTPNEQNSDKNLTLGSNLETSKNIDANIKNIKIIKPGTNEKLQVDLQNKTTSTSNLNKEQNFKKTSDIQDTILEKNGTNTSLNSIKSTPNEQNSDKNLNLGSNLETSKTIDGNIKNIKIIKHGTNEKLQVDLQNKTTSTSNLNKKQKFKETSDIQEIILEKNEKDTSQNSIKSTPIEQNSDINLNLGSNLETSKNIDGNIKNIKIIKHGTNEKLQVDLQNKTTSTSNLNKEQNFKKTSDIQDTILEKNGTNTSLNSIKSTPNEQNSDKNLTLGSNLETSKTIDANIKNIKIIKHVTNEKPQVDLQNKTTSTLNLNKEQNFKETSDIQDIIVEKNVKNTSPNNSIKGTLNEQHPDKNSTLCSNLETSRIIDANIKKIEIPKLSTDEKTQVDLQNNVSSSQNLNKQQNFKETSDIQDIILEKNGTNTSLNSIKSTPNEQNSDKNLNLGSNLETSKTIDGNIKNIKIIKHGTNEKLQVDLQNKTTSTSNLNKKQKFKETSDIQEIILEKNEKDTSQNSIKSTPNEQNSDINLNLGSNLETSKNIDANIKNIKIIKHVTNEKPQVDLQNKTTSTSNLNKEQNFKETSDIQDIIVEKNVKNTSPNNSIKGTLNEQHPDKNSTLCSNLETSRIIDANIKKIEISKLSTDEKTQVDLQNNVSSSQNLNKQQNFKETSDIQDIILEKNVKNTSPNNSIKSTPNEQNSDKNLNLGSNLETSKTIDGNIKNIKIIKHGTNEKLQVDLQNKTTSTSNLNKKQKFKETSDIQEIILEKNEKDTSQNSIKSTPNEQNSDINLNLGSNLETSKNIDANIKNTKIIKPGTNEKLQVNLQNNIPSTQNLNKEHNFKETSDIQDIIVEKNVKNTSPNNSIKGTLNEQHPDKNSTLYSNLETSRIIDANIKKIEISKLSTDEKPQVDLQNNVSSSQNLNKQQNFKETSDIQHIISKKNVKNTPLNSSFKGTFNEQNSDNNSTLDSNFETSKNIDENIKKVDSIKSGSNEKTQVDLQNIIPSTQDLNKEHNFEEISDVPDIILEKNAQNAVLDLEQNLEKNTIFRSNLKTSKILDESLKEVEIIELGPNEKCQADVQSNIPSTLNLNKEQNFKETSDIQDIICNAVKSNLIEQNSEKNTILCSEEFDVLEKLSKENDHLLGRKEFVSESEQILFNTELSFLKITQQNLNEDILSSSQSVNPKQIIHYSNKSLNITETSLESSVQNYSTEKIDEIISVGDSDSRKSKFDKSINHKEINDQKEVKLFVDSKQSIEITNNIKSRNVKLKSKNRKKFDSDMQNVFFKSMCDNNVGNENTIKTNFSEKEKHNINSEAKLAIKSNKEQELFKTQKNNSQIKSRTESEHKRSDKEIESIVKKLMERNLAVKKAENVETDHNEDKNDTNNITTLEKTNSLDAKGNLKEEQYQNSDSKNNKKIISKPTNIICSTVKNIAVKVKNEKFLVKNNKKSKIETSNEENKSKTISSMKKKETKNITNNNFGISKDGEININKYTDISNPLESSLAPNERSVKIQNVSGSLIKNLTATSESISNCVQNPTLQSYNRTNVNENNKKATTQNDQIIKENESTVENNCLEMESVQNKNYCSEKIEDKKRTENQNKAKDSIQIKENLINIDNRKNANECKTNEECQKPPTEKLTKNSNKNIQQEILNNSDISEKNLDSTINFMTKIFNFTEIQDYCEENETFKLEHSNIISLNSADSTTQDMEKSEGEQEKIKCQQGSIEKQKNKKVENEIHSIVTESLVQDDLVSIKDKESNIENVINIVNNSVVSSNVNKIDNVQNIDVNIDSDTVSERSVNVSENANNSTVKADKQKKLLKNNLKRKKIKFQNSNLVHELFSENNLNTSEKKIEILPINAKELNELEIHTEIKLKINDFPMTQDSKFEHSEILEPSLEKVSLQPKGEINIVNTNLEIKAETLNQNEQNSKTPIDEDNYKKMLSYIKSLTDDESITFENSNEIKEINLNTSTNNETLNKCNQESNKDINCVQILIENEKQIEKINTTLNEKSFFNISNLELQQEEKDLKEKINSITIDKESKPDESKNFGAKKQNEKINKQSNKELDVDNKMNLIKNSKKPLKTNTQFCTDFNKTKIKQKSSMNISKNVVSFHKETEVETDFYHSNNVSLNSADSTTKESKNEKCCMDFGKEDIEIQCDKSQQNLDEEKKYEEIKKVENLINKEMQDATFSTSKLKSKYKDTQSPSKHRDINKSITSNSSVTENKIENSKKKNDILTEKNKRYSEKVYVENSTKNLVSKKKNEISKEEMSSSNETKKSYDIKSDNKKLEHIKKGFKEKVNKSKISNLISQSNQKNVSTNEKNDSEHLIQSECNVENNSGLEKESKLIVSAKSEGSVNKSFDSIKSAKNIPENFKPKVLNKSLDIKQEIVKKKEKIEECVFISKNSKSENLNLSQESLLVKETIACENSDKTNKNLNISSKLFNENENTNKNFINLSKKDPDILLSNKFPTNLFEISMNTEVPKNEVQQIEVKNISQRDDKNSTIKKLPQQIIEVSKVPENETKIVEPNFNDKNETKKVETVKDLRQIGNDKGVKDNKRKVVDEFIVNRLDEKEIIAVKNSSESENISQSPTSSENKFTNQNIHSEHSIKKRKIECLEKNNSVVNSNSHIESFSSISEVQINNNSKITKSKTKPEVDKISLKSQSKFSSKEIDNKFSKSTEMQGKKIFEKSSKWQDTSNKDNKALNKDEKKKHSKKDSRGKKEINDEIAKSPAKISVLKGVETLDVQNINKSTPDLQKEKNKDNRFVNKSTDNSSSPTAKSSNKKVHHEELSIYECLFQSPLKILKNEADSRSPAITENVKINHNEKSSKTHSSNSSVKNVGEDSKDLKEEKYLKKKEKKNTSKKSVSDKDSKSHPKENKSSSKIYKKDDNDVKGEYDSSLSKHIKKIKSTKEITSTVKAEVSNKTKKLSDSQEIKSNVVRKIFENQAKKDSKDYRIEMEKNSNKAIIKKDKPQEMEKNKNESKSDKIKQLTNCTTSKQEKLILNDETLPGPTPKSAVTILTWELMNDIVERSKKTNEVSSSSCSVDSSSKSENTDSKSSKLKKSNKQSSSKQKRNNTQQHHQQQQQYTTNKTIDSSDKLNELNRIDEVTSSTEISSTTSFYVAAINESCDLSSAENKNTPIKLRMKRLSRSMENKNATGCSIIESSDNKTETNFEKYMSPEITSKIVDESSSERKKDRSKKRKLEKEETEPITKKCNLDNDRVIDSQETLNNDEPIKNKESLCNAKLIEKRDRKSRNSCNLFEKSIMTHDVENILHKSSIKNYRGKRGRPRNEDTSSSISTDDNMISESEINDAKLNEKFKNKSNKEYKYEKVHTEIKEKPNENVKKDVDIEEKFEDKFCNKKRDSLTELIEENELKRVVETVKEFSKKMSNRIDLNVSENANEKINVTTTNDKNDEVQFIGTKIIKTEKRRERKMSINSKSSLQELNNSNNMVNDKVFYDLSSNNAKILESMNCLVKVKRFSPEKLTKIVKENNEAINYFTSNQLDDASIKIDKKPHLIETGLSAATNLNSVLKTDADHRSKYSKENLSAIEEIQLFNKKLSYSRRDSDEITKVVIPQSGNTITMRNIDCYGSPISNENNQQQIQTKRATDAYLNTKPIKKSFSPTIPNSYSLTSEIHQQINSNNNDLTINNSNNVNDLEYFNPYEPAFLTDFDLADVWNLIPDDKNSLIHPTQEHLRKNSDLLEKKINLDGDTILTSIKVDREISNINSVNDISLQKNKDITENKKSTVKDSKVLVIDEKNLKRSEKCYNNDKKVDIKNNINLLNNKQQLKIKNPLLRPSQIIVPSQKKTIHNVQNSKLDNLLVNFCNPKLRSSPLKPIPTSSPAKPKNFQNSNTVINKIKSIGSDKIVGTQLPKKIPQFNEVISKNQSINDFQSSYENFARNAEFEELSFTPIPDKSFFNTTTTKVTTLNKKSNAIVTSQQIIIPARSHDYTRSSNNSKASEQKNTFLTNNNSNLSSILKRPASASETLEIMPIIKKPKEQPRQLNIQNKTGQNTTGILIISEHLSPASSSINVSDKTSNQYYTKHNQQPSNFLTPPSYKKRVTFSGDTKKK